MKRHPSADLRRSLGEIIVLLGAFATDQWLLKGLSSPLLEIPVFAVLLGVFVTSIRRRGGLERILPLPAEPGARAWAEIIAVTAILAVGLIVWGLAIRTSYDELPPRITEAGAIGILAWSGSHLVWAGLQQLVLQLFLRPVMGEIFKKTALATLATVLVFSLLHLPCPTLVVSTALLGAMWIGLYTRHRRLVPIVLSHALLSATAFVALPPQWNCNLNVGIVAANDLAEYRVLRSDETRRLLDHVTSDAYFKSSGATHSDFIQSLYRDMLRRSPAGAEVQHWLDRMDRGLSRNRVAVAFARSPEYRNLSSHPPCAEKGPP